jgi:hypothetical protein
MKPEKPVQTLRLPSDYAVWLTALKERVRSAQLRAAARVNHELIALYWDIGRQIDCQQKIAGWGARIIPQLALDLHAAFPDQQGFSERNLKRMIAFHREYPDLFPILPQAVAKLGAAAIVPQLAALLSAAEGFTASGAIVPQAAAQLPDPAPASPIMQQLAAQLPWFHHVILIEKVKDRSARAWYMQAAAENGWSRAVLGVQIEQRAHLRAGKAVTNFAATLPPPQSDLAQQTLKDPYVFDFLTPRACGTENPVLAPDRPEIPEMLGGAATG